MNYMDARPKLSNCKNVVTGSLWWTSFATFTFHVTGRMSLLVAYELHVHRKYSTVPSSLVRKPTLLSSQLRSCDKFSFYFDFRTCVLNNRRKSAWSIMSIYIDAAIIGGQQMGLERKTIYILLSIADGSADGAHHHLIPDCAGVHPGGARCDGIDYESAASLTHACRHYTGLLKGCHTYPPGKSWVCAGASLVFSRKFLPGPWASNFVFDINNDVEQVSADWPTVKLLRRMASRIGRKNEYVVLLFECFVWTRIYTQQLVCLCRPFHWG